MSRADSTILEPCSEPFVKLDLVTKEQGQNRLADALETFFANIDEGPRLALRITMGAGKTRETIKKLQAYLADKADQSVEIYVPRHELSEQYVNDIERLDGEFCAEVIHVLPRVSVDPEAYPDMCKRPVYARSLTSMGLGVFHNACRSNDGVRCEHYDSCPYIRQFKMPTPREGTRGNCVRVLSHSYLGLPRNPVQTDPDLVIIDEAFLDVLIDTKTEIALADIKKYIRTDKHPKLGKWIVDALEDREPLLNVLREKGVTCAHLTGIDLDQLRPPVAFNPKVNRPIANSGNGALHRSLSFLLKVLKEELALVPARDNVERLAHDPAKNLIRVAYLKEVDLPDTTPILCLDATADKTLLEEVLGSVKVEQISVEQKAVVTQVYDRTGSKTFWEGNTAPVDELLEVANAWAEFGEKPLIVGHLGLAEKLRDHKSRHDDVAVMHFGALRGSNAAEDCSIIFLTARYQPPMAEIDLKARTLFWSAREPLQHDEGAQFKEKDDHDLKPVKRLRGFVQSSRNTHRQSGVRVTSFSDDRIDALLSQSRDAETMQALGRLRLVHAGYQKRVFLLSNLPVEMPVDSYAQFSDLMPDRLEFELIKHGNIPLTPLGLAKMRPDLVTSTANAEKLLQRSKVRTTSRLKAIPELVRCGMFIIEFEAENAGRWNSHQHLFIVSDQVGERQADAPNVVLMGGPVPLQDWVQILEKGWGAIRNPHLSFA